jgi:hypothetical protein
MMTTNYLFYEICLHEESGNMVYLSTKEMSGRVENFLSRLRDSGIETSPGPEAWIVNVHALGPEQESLARDIYRLHLDFI